MSNSVSISVATNSVIALAKGFGWFVTGSPTLFAETVHSLADVGNQVLLKVGEVRARAGPNREHPFGLGQEKFFWALVSAVSVFFVGCGINLYHGIHSLLTATVVEPFTPLIIGLLLFALALEGWTFTVALKEIGGWRGIAKNRNNTTVLAVLLEDAVALFGILLTLLVAGSGWIFGPNPLFDAWVAIAVGALLGVMALFLAAINRAVLIDVSDQALDAEARRFLAARGVDATVHSLVLDNDRAIAFVSTPREVAASAEVAAELKSHMIGLHGKTVDDVYWRVTPASGTPAHG